MKSKMPCPPAFMPVIRFDHATGLCGGMLVVSKRNESVRASVEKFGILPSAVNCRRRSGSMPSIPRMISFWSPCHCRDCRHEDSDRLIAQSARKSPDFVVRFSEELSPSSVASEYYSWNSRLEHRSADTLEMRSTR